MVIAAGLVLNITVERPLLALCRRIGLSRPAKNVMQLAPSAR
jgi:hypothetical protein